MDSFIIDNIDDKIIKKLRQRAERNGRSMEEEVREILNNAARAFDDEEEGLGTRIARRFQGIGLKEGELEALPRQEPRAVDFGE